MKINEQILSLPPYLSTSWENVHSLHVQQKENQNLLIIILNNENKVIIPDLKETVINMIFEMHAKVLEKKSSIQKKRIETNLGLGIPLQMGGNLETLGGNIMQHNQEQSHAPDLPSELLNKIINIAKVLGMEDPENMPQPEPHCNCFHCQIARALIGKISMIEEDEEKVTEADLKFREWDIKQKDEQLYLVTNPLDQKEQYNVFLGKPLGCTCGQKNCEHIRAVLNS